LCSPETRSRPWARRNSSDAALLWSISFAIRDGIGNGLFYGSLLVLGAPLWARNCTTGLALANHTHQAAGAMR